MVAQKITDILIPSFEKAKSLSLSKNTMPYWFAAIGSILFVLIVRFFGDAMLAYALFPILAALLWIINDFNLSLMLMVAMLFLNFNYSYYSSAILFSLPLGLSFILKYNNVTSNDLRNPLNTPMSIYLMSILPSFLFMANPRPSLFMLSHLAGFIIVFYSIVGGVKTYKQISSLVIVYIILTLLNSLDVIRLFMSGMKRPFGFAGLWFVDYSALGVCLALAIAIVKRNYIRWVFLFIALIVLIALLLTQTRNAWISALLTLLILVGCLIVYPGIIDVSRAKIVKMAMICGIAFVGVILLIALTLPKVTDRVNNLRDKAGYSIDESGHTDNSFVSRLLIWDTAYNAFRAHPIVGMGIYAFQFSSKSYSTLPKILYRRFVELRHPHQTFIAVLAETGLLGFAGFLVFFIVAIRHAFLSLKLAVSAHGKNYAFVAAIGVCYCSVSMFFTDAWLWGQQLILLGIIYGIMFAIRKINIAVLA
jgi:O-antigen ligase